MPDSLVFISDRRSTSFETGRSIGSCGNYVLLDNYDYNCSMFIFEYILHGLDEDMPTKNYLTVPLFSPEGFPNKKCSGARMRKSFNIAERPEWPAQNFTTTGDFGVVWKLVIIGLDWRF